MTLPVFGPGYHTGECMEILRLAAAVSTFVPRYEQKGMAALDPLAPADGSPVADTFPAPAGQPVPLPSLFTHRWPAGWVAGLWVGAKPTWAQSIIVSEGHSFANQAVLIYNPQADAYCLAFRGTMTPGNALEDLMCVMVPAGPVNLKAYAQHLREKAEAAKNKAASWLLRAEAAMAGTAGFVHSNRWYCAADIPGVSERAHVHMGFRLALESLDYAATSPAAAGNRGTALEILLHDHSLTGMLTELGRRAMGRPIKLYVTGHSLGAGMASLAASWLSTQPIPGATFDIKCYAFAQPKPGDDYFASAGALGLGPSRAFAVLNTLDTIPQVGLTYQNLHSLNYQGCVDFLINAMGAAGQAVEWATGTVAPAMNYVHWGTVVYLKGEPVVPGATPEDPSFYALPPVAQTERNSDSAPATAESTDQMVQMHRRWLLSRHRTAKPDTAPTTASPPTVPVYQFPAYLFTPATPDQPNDYIPPPESWNVAVTTDVQSSAVVASFAPLWQHMPWIYMQALAKEMGLV